MTAELQRAGLDFIIDRVDVGILVVTRDFEVILWNRFMEAHSGISHERIVGSNLLESFPELPGKWLTKKLRSVFILNNFAFSSWQQRPYLFRFKHHRPITGGAGFMYQNCTFIPFKNQEGDQDLVCITVFDVTDVAIVQKQLSEARERMEQLSNQDSLTGVYNRRYLQIQLAREFNRVVRNGGALSVLFIDLDHFKSVNDTYGHPTGDHVLVEVAQRIKDAIRTTDYLARYGGEEFAVVLSDTGINGGINVANRIRERIAEAPFVFEGQTITMTASLGLSEYRGTVETPESLLAESDEALYSAKQGGRNRVVCYKET